MPEEINRVVTDSITNWFFTTSEVANANLRRAGVGDERIFFVGNTMIDTLLKQMPRLRAPGFWGELGLVPGQYFVVTLHRPANVDGEQQLLRLLRAIADGAGRLPVVFPVHPRTAKNLRELGAWEPHPHPSPPLEGEGENHKPARGSGPAQASPPLDGEGENHPVNSGGLVLPLQGGGREGDGRILFVDPQPYLEFNYLVKHAKGVITDSGGHYRGNHGDGRAVFDAAR